MSRGRGRDNFRITRVVWEAVNGPIPEGLLVLHKCDNPPCYRLDHLFLGDHFDNARDCENKGRGNHPRGADNGRAKLEPEQVREIRHLISEGQSNATISKTFGIHKNTVQSIRNGSNWKWLK